MEELLSDFLAEANDHLSRFERQIVAFENDPSDADSIASIFRLLHTLKGTSGFLDLARLERLTHVAETLIGKARDKGSATHAQVDLILQTVDIVQDILEGLAAQGQEPKGDDSHLIRALEAAAELADNPQPSADNERTMAAKIEPVIQTSAKAIRDDHYNNAPAYQARDTNSIRVTIGTLERIMRLVSELVLTRNQLMELARKQESAAIMAPLQRLSAITTDL